MTSSFSGAKLMIVPPAVLPGNITNWSPPLFRSTDTSGPSQLLKPSLVVNLLQTSGSGAGMDISMINACLASAGKT